MFSISVVSGINDRSNQRLKPTSVLEDTEKIVIFGFIYLISLAILGREKGFALANNFLINAQCSTLNVEYSMRSIFSSRPDLISSIGDLHSGQLYCKPI